MISDWRSPWRMGSGRWVGKGDKVPPILPIHGYLRGLQLLQTLLCLGSTAALFGKVNNQTHNIVLGDEGEFKIK